MGDNNVLGVRLSVVDDATSKTYKVGDRFRRDEKEYIYLKVASSAVTLKVTNGACSNGRPAAYVAGDGEAKCFNEVTAQNRSSKLLFGLNTASVGKYTWFQSKGYHSAVKKDGSAFTGGDRLISESHSHTIARRVNNVAAAAFTGGTALIQGYINTATSASATTAGCTLYGF